MTASVKANVIFMIKCLAVLWGVELCNLLVGHRLSAWGIVPRSLFGLLGIPLSPFLHANFFHLLVNTLPFVILGSFVMLQGKKTFLEVSLLIIFLGGVGVWLLGRSAVHVGASGVIFGYFGFLVTHGWYSRNRTALLVGLLTLLLYGGMLWGVLPTTPWISWEGHLFGLLVGGLAARLKAQDEDGQLAKV